MGKGEERLLPEDGRDVVRVDEGGEVAHERIDDAVRQGVLLEQQRAQEEGVGGGEGHLGQLEDRDGRMQHWDRDLLKHRGEDVRLPDGAVVLAERQQEALEEGGRLVERALQREVEVEVELVVLLDVALRAGRRHGECKRRATATAPWPEARWVRGDAPRSRARREARCVGG